MTKASELETGMKVTRHTQEGVVLEKTARTVTVKFPFSVCKWTFKKDCSLFELGLTVID